MAVPFGFKVVERAKSAALSFSETSYCWRRGREREREFNKACVLFLLYGHTHTRRSFAVFLSIPFLGVCVCVCGFRK